REREHEEQEEGRAAHAPREAHPEPGLADPHRMQVQEDVRKDREGAVPGIDRLRVPDDRLPYLGRMEVLPGFLQSLHSTCSPGRLTGNVHVDPSPPSDSLQTRL